MLCTFYYDVVTAVCQLLINEYVMFVMLLPLPNPHHTKEKGRNL